MSQALNEMDTAQLKDMQAQYEAWVKRLRTSAKPSEKVMMIVASQRLVEKCISPTEDKVTVEPRSDGEFGWHRTAPNGEVLSSGEGYTRSEDAVRGARRANPDFRYSPIPIVSYIEPEEEKHVTFEDNTFSETRPNVGTPEHAIADDLPFGSVHPVDPEALKTVPSRAQAEKKGKPGTS